MADRIAGFVLEACAVAFFASIILFATAHVWMGLLADIRRWRREARNP